MGQCVAKGNGLGYDGDMVAAEVTVKENSSSTSGLSSKRDRNSSLSKRLLRKSTKSSVSDASTPRRNSETHSLNKVVVVEVPLDNKVDKDAKQLEWDDNKRAGEQVAGNVNENERTKTAAADANKKLEAAPIRVPTDGEEGKVWKGSVEEAVSPAGMVERDAQKPYLRVDKGGVREKSGQQATNDESAEQRSAKGEEVVEKVKGQEYAPETLSPILEKERILDDESLKQQPAPAEADRMESVTNIKGACRQNTHMMTESTSTESDSVRLTAEDNAAQLYHAGDPHKPLGRGDPETGSYSERVDAKVGDEDRLQEDGTAAILNIATNRCDYSAIALDLPKTDSGEVMGGAQIGSDHESDDHMSAVDENSKANDGDDDDVVADLTAISKGPQSLDRAGGDEDRDIIRESPTRAVTLLHQGSIALTHEEMEALFGRLQSPQ